MMLQQCHRIIPLKEQLNEKEKKMIYLYHALKLTETLLFPMNYR